MDKTEYTIKIQLSLLNAGQNANAGPNANAVPNAKDFKKLACVEKSLELEQEIKDLFNFKSNSDEVGTLVSMIPSFDGIWHDFIKVVFVDAENISDGGYTVSFTESLIYSINSIYNINKKFNY